MRTPTSTTPKSMPGRPTLRPATDRPHDGRSTSFPRPTRREILAARGNTIPDVIAPDLRVLFCGINPGLYSGAVRRHFARPGNRFWPVLHLSGFTKRVLSPFDQRELLEIGAGITNIVRRSTATADEIGAGELRLGAVRLAAKVRRYRPRYLAVLGIVAYRAAFDRPTAALGPQPHAIGASRIWVLPNPSGLNAHYQMRELARLFATLRAAANRRTR
jgi:TDG/mug DNA glycosylase family protein